MDNLITQTRLGILKDLRRALSHEVIFYTADKQFWFNNLTTSTKKPLPIQLLQNVEISSSAELRRAGMEKLRQYIEKL